LITAVVLAAVVIGACARSPSTIHVSPQEIYASGLPTDTMQSLLGGTDWWPGPPSFEVRPLKIETMPQQIEFSITSRYQNIGSSDTFEVLTQVWDSTTSASAHMSGVQNLLGTSLKGPNVGDQALYYQQGPGPGSPSYTTVEFVRLGQTVATLTWTRGSAFATIAQIGKVATKVVSRLKDVLAGKVRPSPQPSADTSLLPPVGTDITLLGMARLPIEAFPLMMSVAAPKDLATTLHNLGVNDFLFADYVLDNDTSMEVRAAVLTFSVSSDAQGLVDAFRGGSDTANPIFVTYQDISGPGQYYLMFAAKAQFAILICRSTSLTQAASRSCENPLTRVGQAWFGLLGG
jgi:hypothetical protein